ncbi:MAG: hypothetical protein GY711_18545 [bacterium]|nr:hypothetical protein [bacterium]
MFKLDHLTDAKWVARVAAEPLALLSDHALCELKAAASAQSLIAKNPERRELVEGLAEVSVEEMEHFRRVVGVLHARGGTLGPALPSPYADGLHRAAKRSRFDQLLDRLVVAELIEARSLERFHLLATHLEDRELAELYGSLMASEAGHQALFAKLARRYFPEAVVVRREAELRAEEGALIARLTFAPCMHSGLAPGPVASDRA